MLKFFRTAGLILLSATLLLSGCSPTVQSTPTVEPQVAYTQAAQTAQAILTNAALLTPSATITPTPTQTSTPEPPTATFTVTLVTPLASPTITPQSSVDSAIYVDQSPSDGTIVTPGSEFNVTWRIKEHRRFNLDYQISITILCRYNHVTGHCSKSTEYRPTPGRSDRHTTDQSSVRCRRIHHDLGIIQRTGCKFLQCFCSNRCEWCNIDTYNCCDSNHRSYSNPCRHPLMTHQHQKLDFLKAEAESLGFFLCGVTDLKTPEHFPEFQQWIQDGYHAGMGYLARPDTIAKRADPRLIMPESAQLNQPGDTILPGSPRTDFDKFTDVWAGCSLCLGS